MTVDENRKVQKRTNCKIYQRGEISGYLRFLGARRKGGPAGGTVETLQAEQGDFKIMTRSPSPCPLPPGEGMRLAALEKFKELGWMKSVKVSIKQPTGPPHLG